MSYALVIDGTIEAVGGLPRSARRLDNDAWVMGLASAPVAEREACGWFAITSTDRPAGTDTTTHDRSVELVDGTPTVVWTERDLTADELSERGAATPEQTTAIVAKLLLGPKVRAEDLTDDEIAEAAPLFPAWLPGLDVAVGDVFRWDGTLVEVIQAHTTQADWTPDVVPALFKVHRTPDMTEWTAGISVSVGEEFTYQGTTYRVLQAHTTASHWAPDVTPSLWLAT